VGKFGGEGCGGVLENKTGNISETHKEKLLWRAYRNALSNSAIPDPYSLPFSKIGGSQPDPKTAITIISGTAKATDCKFGRYIHRVHPNTSP